MVRVAWGGGTEKLWEGSIAVNHGTISQPRPLGIEADEAGSMWLDDGRLQIRQRSPRAYDGVDIIVTAAADAKLVVQLTAAGDAQRGSPIEIPLTDIASAEISGVWRNLQLDDHENRLLVRRAPGDSLLVRTSHSSMVFYPGEKMQFDVVPHMLPVATDTRVQINTQLLDAQQRQLWSSEQEMRGSGEAIPLEITLPEEEGVYDIVITAQQKSGWPRALRPSLHWKRAIVERRVQLIVIARQQPAVKVGRELTQILEIDPTTSRWWEKVKLPQWSQLPQMPQISRLPRFSHEPSGPLGNGMRETIHHPLGDISQLKPCIASPDVSWEAYTLNVGPAGRPYVLEVDYPSDVPQNLGLSIIETNAAGILVPIGLDSGVDVAEETAAAVPHWERHRLVFWPRTSSPLLLVTNRRERSPAVYGKIRVLGGWKQLPKIETATTAKNSFPQRLIAGYMDRPLLPENFTAEEVLDTWSGRTLQDWRTFHQAGTRLVEYLHYTGYNGIVLAVAADGSAIYPSPVFEPTPRYDTGVFFASGQDPMQKDVLEMLLRLMDRENLQLIPSLEFATPLPALEAIRRRGGREAQGLEWIGADGATWCQTNAPRRGLAPYYNTLDPRVQEVMLSAVRELVQRYAGHASFRGLALRLSAYGYAQLPGPEWGMDDATIARFEHDTGLKVRTNSSPTDANRTHHSPSDDARTHHSPSDDARTHHSPSDGIHPAEHDEYDEHRFAARAAFLTSDEHRGRWLQWRAEECHKFYHRIQAILAAARPEMPLYLAGAEMLAGPDIEAELRPALPQRSSLAMAFLNAGIDLRLYRDDAQVVLLRPQRILPASQLNAQAADLELSQISEAAFFFRGLPQSGSLFFHPPQEVRIPSFDQKVAIKSSCALLLTQAVPSGMRNRQRFAENLAAHDSQILIDGGWMLPLGQEDAMYRFAASFRQLPAVHFNDAEESHSGQPVVFRCASLNGKTFAYAVNTTPFPVTAQVRVTATPNCTIEDLCSVSVPLAVSSVSVPLASNSSVSVPLASDHSGVPPSSSSSVPLVSNTSSVPLLSATTGVSLASYNSGVPPEAQNAGETPTLHAAGETPTLHAAGETPTLRAAAGTATPQNHAGRLKNDAEGISWVIELAPYDMAAVAFSEANVRLLQPQASLSGAVADSIARRIHELGARTVALRNPSPLNILENPGFQSKPSEADPVPGWAVSKRLGVSITTDTTQGHAAAAGARSGGAQSARLFSEGPIACLVSKPFAPPLSGRITMLVWLRVADAAHQPNLRLAVEGKLIGRDYYRYTVIGQPQEPGQEAKLIGTAWRQYLVQFNDVPLDGLSQMRVRLDLMGPGEVWADDVQLFDLAFSESEIRALYKLLTLADLNLQNGQVGDCMKLLNGYWPRFLAQNVPLPQDVPSLASKPASAPPPTDQPSDGKPAAAQPATWTDRMKGMLPERLR